MVWHEYGIVPVHAGGPTTQPWQYSGYALDPQYSIGHRVHDA